MNLGPQSTSETPGSLVQAQITILRNPQSFWISKSGLGADNLYCIIGSQEMLLPQVREHTLKNKVEGWVESLGARGGRQVTVVRWGLTVEVPSEPGLEDMRGLATEMPERASQAEGTWECSWCVWRTSRRLLWLEWYGLGRIIKNTLEGWQEDKRRTLFIIKGLCLSFSWLGEFLWGVR